MAAPLIIGVEAIVQGVIGLIDKNMDLESKKFDALSAEDKAAVGKLYFENEAMLHEHRRNFHALLMRIWDLLGGAKLVESRPKSREASDWSDVSGNQIDGP